MLNVNLNLEEQNESNEKTQKKNFNMFDFDSLSARERIALFGEQTKPTKNILRKLNPLHKIGNNDYETFKRIPVDQNSTEAFKAFHKKTFKEKLKKLLQKFVISPNNPYKSAWDFFLLLITSYNTMIVCY